MTFNYKPSKKRNNQKKAFTLGETLLSLLILALILQSLMTCLKNFRQVDDSLRNDRYLEWQHFCLVFEKELQGFKVNNLSNQQIDLIVSQDTRKGARVILNHHKIYKTPGYQPYLYQVKDWSITRMGSFLNIEVEFTNQQVFSHAFKVHFADEGLTNG